MHELRGQIPDSSPRDGACSRHGHGKPELSQGWWEAGERAREPEKANKEGDGSASRTR